MRAFLGSPTSLHIARAALGTHTTTLQSRPRTFSSPPSPDLRRMSLKPSFRYINAEELAELIKANPQGAGTTWAVVDVRDSDFAGGNIVGALNYPADKLLDNMNELVTRIENVPKVVFHCALSQVRGPKAARRYAEAREVILKENAPEQEVLVLREGFTGFQQRFRNDAVLVEKFNKYYHD